MVNVKILHLDRLSGDLNNTCGYALLSALPRKPHTQWLKLKMFTLAAAEAAEKSDDR